MKRRRSETELGCDRRPLRASVAASSLVGIFALIASCHRNGLSNELEVTGIVAPEQIEASGAELVSAANDCKKGDRPSCLSLGVAYARGLQVTADLARAEELLDGLCKNGQALACRELAAAEEKSDPHRSKERYLRAAGLLRYVCDQEASDGIACFMLAELYADGHGPGQSLTRAEALSLRARTLLTRSCDSGKAPSCYYLARAFEQGIGSEVDVAKASELFDKTCRGGYRQGCFAVISSIDPRKIASPQDKAAIAKRLVVGCENNAGSACEFLSRGYGDDPKQMVNARAKACSLDDAEACSAIALDSHDPGSNDAAKKTELLLDQACSLGIARACRNLAEVVRKSSRERSRGARRRAVALNDAACDADDAAACARAADAHARGLGVAPDRELAKRRYKMACDAGLDGACKVDLSTEEAKFAARPQRDIARMPGTILGFAKADHDYVIAVDASSTPHCDQKGGTARILRVGHDGGEPTPLATDVCAPAGLIANARFIAWVDRQGAVFSCEAAHCNSLRRSPKGSSFAVPIAASNDGFALYQESPQKRIAHYDFANGEPSTFVSVDERPAAMAFDGDSLIWSEPASGNVRRAPSGGPERLLLHFAGSPGALTTTQSGGVAVVSPIGDLLLIHDNVHDKIATDNLGNAISLAASDGWIHVGLAGSDLTGAAIRRVKESGQATQSYYAASDGAVVGIFADEKCDAWAYVGSDGQSGIEEACDP